MTPGNHNRSGRVASRVSVVAFVWALGLILAALLVPVYSQAESTSSGLTLTTVTLVQENGPSVLIPVAVPALICTVVGLALRRKCLRGGRRSGTVAWVGVGLLAVFALLSGLSIGIFVVPVALLLGWAAATTPAPAA